MMTVCQGTWSLLASARHTVMDCADPSAHKHIRSPLLTPSKSSFNLQLTDHRISASFSSRSAKMVSTNVEDANMKFAPGGAAFELRATGTQKSKSNA